MDFDTLGVYPALGTFIIGRINGAKFGVSPMLKCFNGIHNDG
jgi:hypothetical protein